MPAAPTLPTAYADNVGQAIPASAIADLARAANSSRQVVNVKAYGAIADGSNHLITTGDIALHTEWIGTYAVGDQWDYAAFQEAIYAAFAGKNSTAGNLVWNGAGAITSNRPLFIPAGTYLLNKALFAKNIAGARVFGDGRLTTTLKRVTPFPAGTSVWSIDGCSHSHFSDFGFQSTGNHGTNGMFMDVDYTGSGGSLHGIKFHNIHFDASSGGASVEIAVRAAHSVLQGDTFSFDLCYWQGFKVACFAAYGYNSLSHKFDTCDFTGSATDHVYIETGSAQLFNCQSEGVAWGANAMTGYMLNCAGGAGNHPNTMIGCRLETPRLGRFNGGGAGVVTLIGNTTAAGPLKNWVANTAYVLNDSISADASTGGSVYVCTTAGTSGPTIPSPWPVGGATVADGTAVWTHQDFDTVSAACSIYAANNLLSYGTITTVPTYSPGTFIHNQFTRTDWLRSTNNPYDDSTIGATRWGPIAFGNYVVKSGVVGSGSPSAFNAPGYLANTDIVADIAPFWLGKVPIIWTAGSGNTMWGDVGLGRNDGTSLPNNVGGNDQTRYSRNVLAMLGDGSLGKPVPTTADTAGKDLRLQGGLGTGTGVGGAVSLRASVAGSTGTTPNNAAERLRAEAAGVRFQAYTKSGAPVVGDLPAGMAAVFKDSGGGGVVLAYNDGGTIKTVALV